MMEQKISFHQKFVGQNGQILEIKFEGISFGSENVEKVLSLLTNIGQNFQYGSELVNYVRYSRYLLRKFEEKFLSFSYRDETGYFESVQYDCQKLSSYICKFRASCTDIWTEFHFASGMDNDLQISMSGIGKSAVYDRKSSVKGFVPVIQKLCDLENCKAFSPNDQLIEMYSLFYQEAPDFGSEENQIKAYAMIGILVELGFESRTFQRENPCWVNGIPDYTGFLLSFDFSNQLGMPIETGICRDMRMLSPFGELEKSSTKNWYSESNQATIQLIGSVVCEEMAKQSNPIDFLKSVSKSLYYYDYNFYRKNLNMEMTNTCELELTLSLLKRIRKVLVPQIVSNFYKRLEGIDDLNEVFQIHFQYFIGHAETYHDNIYDKVIDNQDLDEISSDVSDPTRVAIVDIRNKCRQVKNLVLEMYKSRIF